MKKKVENIEEVQNEPLSKTNVSNSFICDSCDKKKDNKYSVMLTDEWYVCKDCFEKESVGHCEYSALCEYTGECDEAC
jgi:formylmethanofuran dehydrogenase subunit E